MNFFFLCSILLLGNAEAALLSPELCRSHSTELYATASTMLDQAAADILSMGYSKISNGVMVNVVDEDDGEDAGGGTNTNGSYQTIFFNGTDIFPPGICDIPGNTGDPRCDSESGSTLSFLLGPADVMVFIACTPPEMRYFSFDTIIDARLTEEYPFYPGQPFGDTISNMNINTTNSDIFDQPVLVLHSADAAAATAVADLFVSAGIIDRESISIRYVDADIVRLWDRSNGQSWEDSKPDILSFVSRMTMPISPGYNDYKSILWPCRMYFADDKSVAKDPVQSPPLKQRYSDEVTNEVQTLSDAFLSLKKSIKDTFEGTFTGAQTVNYSEEGYYDDWDVVLERKNNDSFAVPTRDAIYGLPVCLDDGECKLTESTGAVVIGVLHRDVLPALYNSVGVSVMNIYTGQYSESHWLMDTDLFGSAHRYLNDAVAGSLYAVDFMPPGKCKGVEEPQWCIEFNSSSMPHIGHNPYLILGERIYGVVETKVGPSENSTLGTELLVFSV